MDSYLVCYDISNPKRLRKVAKTCEDFGYRKQLTSYAVGTLGNFPARRLRTYDE